MDEGNEGNKEMELLESDILEDNTLEQQVQEEITVGTRKSRNAKALDANPGKRISFLDEYTNI